MEGNRRTPDATSVDRIPDVARSLDAASAFLRMLVPLPGSGSVEPLSMLPMSGAGRTAPRVPAVDDARSGIAAPATSIVAQAASILDEEMARGVLAARGNAASPGSDDAAHPVLGHLQQIVDSLGTLWPSLQGGSASVPATSAAPGPAPVTLRPRMPVAPGQRVDISMTLRNRKAQAVRLLPSSTDLVGSRGGRIAGALFEFQPAEVALQPQEHRELAIRCTVPQDAGPGTYAGLLVLTGSDDLRALLVVEVAGPAIAVSPPAPRAMPIAPAPDSPVLQEAARLAADGELGNSDAIRLLEMAPRLEEIEAVLSRFDKQLTRESRSKLTLAAFVPLPAGVHNQRYEPIFDRYPLSGRTFTTKSGERALAEVQYYNGEMAQVHGECSNVEAVRGILAGSGYKPVTLRRADGSEHAVAQLWANQLTDTSLRPYNAMFLIVVAVPDAVPEARSCMRADPNGASGVLAALDGRFDPAGRFHECRSSLYFVRLLDTTQIAIDVGRERMGTDKRPGRIELVRDGRQRVFSIWNWAGHAVARISFSVTENASEGASALAHAASTAGATLPEFPVGTEFLHPVAARIGDGPIVPWQWRTDVVARFQPVQTGMVQVDPNSEEGGMLVRWGFEPKWLGYIANVRGAATGLR